MAPREFAPFRVLPDPETGAAPYLVVGTDARGKRLKRKFRVKAQAERMRAKWQRDRDLELAGLKESIGQTTLCSEALEEYLRDRSRHVKPRTLQQMRKSIGDFLTYAGPRVLSDIDYASARRWRTQRGEEVAPGSVNFDLRKLRAFVKWCVRERLLATDPLAELEKASGGKVREAYALTDEQISVMLEVAPRVDQPPHTRVLALRFLLLTGCRWQEMARLVWGDLRLEGSVLQFHRTTTKGKRSRSFPVEGDLADLIDELRALAVARRGRLPQAGDPMLTAPMGAAFPSNAYHFRQWLYKVLDAAAIPRVNERGEVAHVHALRHTWATRMILAGVSISKVAALGGWARLETLQAIYAHVKASDARDDVAAIRLPRANGPEVREDGGMMETTSLRVFARDARRARICLEREGFTLPPQEPASFLVPLPTRDVDGSGPDSGTVPEPGGQGGTREDIA